MTPLTEQQSKEVNHSAYLSTKTKDYCTALLFLYHKLQPKGQHPNIPLLNDQATTLPLYARSPNIFVAAFLLPIVNVNTPHIVVIEDKIMHCFAFPHPDLSRQMFGYEDNKDGLPLADPMPYFPEFTSTNRLPMITTTEYVDTIPYPPYHDYIADVDNNALLAFHSLIYSFPSHLSSVQDILDWLRYPELTAQDLTTSTLRTIIKDASGWTPRPPPFATPHDGPKLVESPTDRPTKVLPTGTSSAPLRYKYHTPAPSLIQRTKIIPPNTKPSMLPTTDPKDNYYYRTGIENRLHDRPITLFERAPTEEKTPKTSCPPPLHTPGDEWFGKATTMATTIRKPDSSISPTPPTSDSQTTQADDSNAKGTPTHSKGHQQRTLQTTSHHTNEDIPPNPTTPIDQHFTQNTTKGSNPKMIHSTLETEQNNTKPTTKPQALYEDWKKEKAINLKTVLDLMPKPTQPRGFNVEINHNLRTATININGLTPIKVAYMVQTLIHYNIDILTIQDTRLSQRQGDYYAAWLQYIMGPGSWTKAFHAITPPPQPSTRGPYKRRSGGQLILIGPKWGHSVTRHFQDESGLAIMVGVEILLERPTILISTYWPHYTTTEVQRATDSTADSRPLASRLTAFLRKAQTECDIPTYLNHQINVWHKKFLGDDPESTLIMMGDFNQGMVYARSRQYDPIAPWMLTYGLTNFLWDACKEHNQHYNYTPELLKKRTTESNPKIKPGQKLTAKTRQLMKTTEATTYQHNNSVIHMLYTQSDTLRQVAGWSSIHPMRYG
jgi:hypothetical protein